MMYMDGSSGAARVVHSYSAVPIRSETLELTSSKMRSSAVFFEDKNWFVAFREVPLVVATTLEVEDLAATSSDSNSRQAVSKWSRLIKIWTI